MLVAERTLHCIFASEVTRLGGRLCMLMAERIYEKPPSLIHSGSLRRLSRSASSFPPSAGRRQLVITRTQSLHRLERGSLHEVDRGIGVLVPGGMTGLARPIEPLAIGRLRDSATDVALHGARAVEKDQRRPVFPALVPDLLKQRVRCCAVTLRAPRGECAARGASHDRTPQSEWAQCAGPRRSHRAVRAVLRRGRYGCAEFAP
jgi:hypothetical protein